MWLMLQQEVPSDYVIATGEGATVRDFAKEAFECVGLDWSKYVEIDNRYIRPTEVDALIGDSTKAKNMLKWEARTKWKELAKIMVEHDLSSFQK
jgi:GDPmannose 4,6-dehydratase